MSSQGCWAYSVRDAICPIVRAAASCDKSQHCLELLFLFISLVVLRAVQYSTRMSPVASMMAETLPPPPPLRFMYPEAGEWKREIVRWGRKEGWGRRARKERVLLVGGRVWTETQGQYQLRTNTSAPQSSVLALAWATQNKLVSSSRPYAFVRLYSHKLIALRDLICVGMSQKNKKQSLGGTMENGVGGERMEGFTD